MKAIVHKSAKPSHYDFQAAEYDIVSEENAYVINATIESILKKYKAKKILDVSCGTGAQVFWLIERGFDVVGTDISQKMLNVAKSKAKKSKQSVKFIKGDMRNIKVGKFDAILSIFNAIGHLTKSDFSKTMRNAGNNLNANGLFIFDIFNLNYLLKGDHIANLTLDRIERTPKSITRKIQYSTIDHKGILASFTTLSVQNGSAKLKVKYDEQTLQVYALKQLKEMLEKNGFKMVHHCNPDGSRFSDTKSERMLVVAKKVT